MKKIIPDKYDFSSLNQSPITGATKNAMYNVVANIAQLFSLDLDPDNAETQEAARDLIERLSDGFDAAGGLYDPSDLPQIDLYITWRVEYTNIDNGRTGHTFFESRTEEEAKHDFLECFRHHEYRIDNVYPA